jgi:hypothetical protein
MIWSVGYIHKCILKKFHFFQTENMYPFFLHLPNDAQLNCLKNNFKIYIKIDIKTAPCLGVIAIIREGIIRSR